MPVRDADENNPDSLLDEIRVANPSSMCKMRIDIDSHNCNVVVHLLVARLVGNLRFRKLLPLAHAFLSEICARHPQPAARGSSWWSQSSWWRPRVQMCTRSARLWRRRTMRRVLRLRTRSRHKSCLLYTRRCTCCDETIGRGISGTEIARAAL